MTTFLIAFVSLALLLGAFAYLALPMVGRVRRGLVSGSFAVLLGLLFFGYSDMLGRPKSAQLEVLNRSAGEARVLGAYFNEGDGVFLWLQLPNVSEPRYYKLPWDAKLVQSVQSAIEQNAQHHGGGVAMKLPFERSWSMEDPKFYPLPQPKLPDKPYEHDQPKTLLYQAPEQGI